MIDTCIMMVTYNRLDLTKKTLDNLFKTTDNFNLVIVDNGSSDGTKEYLNDIKNNNIKLSFNEKNQGIAYGRNKALKIANDFSPNFFATIDNDVILPQNWLLKCKEVLENVKSYGIIGVNFENKKYPVVNVGGLEFQNKPQGNIGTAGMVFPKALHNMIGYFSQEYGLYGEEDADFSWRARISGFKIGYIKENGKHIGEGEVDTGEYRKFKDACRKNNLDLFYKNCRLYSSGNKSVYISFKNE